MTGRRIGVLGGTFDPVHTGHLVAAVNVRHEFQLDVLLLVVANEPWQKVGSRPVSPAADRLALVEAAVEGVDGLEASAIEIERGGVSYTADTIAALREREPDAELFVVIGADVAATLDTWMRFDDVIAEAQLVIVNRPGTTVGEVGEGHPLRRAKAHAVEIPALEISSTDLRDRAATGRPLEYLVPPGAIREIERRGLYRVS